MHPWLAQRTAQFDSSGIRKVFDLAARMKNPINLSIGQPDFPVPAAVKAAAREAIDADKNGYSQTQGIAPLLEKLQAQIKAQYKHDDRRVLITSGTSGALVLAMLALVDPGDEVIIFDPYFVMYPALVAMVGGKPVYVDTYPDFKIDLSKVEAAITPRTKVILFNSPANPTGVVADESAARGLADLAARHNIALVSDEIYRLFSYDGALPSPAEWNPNTIVVDGFSKTYGVTGWRLGWVHGDHREDDHAAAVHLRVRPAPAAMGGARRAGSRHGGSSRRVRPPTRLHRQWTTRRRLRSRPHGRRLLRLSQGSRRRRRRPRLRRPRHRKRAFNNSRRHFQPPRLPLPHFLCRQPSHP
jgi:aspartate aminotransferase/aminotransferase